MLKIFCLRSSTASASDISRYPGSSPNRVRVITKKTLSQKAWKVKSTSVCIRKAWPRQTRFFHFPRGLIGKVKARICEGSTFFSSIRYFILSVITVVLPVPAPAIIKSGPLRCLIAQFVEI